MTIQERKSRAMQVPSEIANFMALVRRLNPRTIVEIGSAEGGTLARWIDTPGVELVVSIDLPNGPFGGNPNRLDVVIDCTRYASERDVTFVPINRDSRVALPELEAVLEGRKIDLLFIDGNHSLSGVTSDFALYSPLARVVALHDITESEWHRKLGVQVPEFWRVVKARHAHEEITDREGSIRHWPHTDGFGGIGVLYLEET